ncbi:unnamed protein product, partial [Iphiclides podalirius]
MAEFLDGEPQSRDSVAFSITALILGTRLAYLVKRLDAPSTALTGRVIVQKPRQEPKTERERPRPAQFGLRGTVTDCFGLHTNFGISSLDPRTFAGSASAHGSTKSYPVERTSAVETRRFMGGPIELESDCLDLRPLYSSASPVARDTHLVFRLEFRATGSGAIARRHRRLSSGEIYRGILEALRVSDDC